MNRLKQRLAKLEAQRGQPLSDIGKWVVYDSDGRHEFDNAATARAACPDAFDPENSIEIVVKADEQTRKNASL